MAYDQKEYENLLKQFNGYGAFTYDKQGEVDRLVKAVANPMPFTYDAQNDPLYSAYAKTYLREGDRAAADALARAAAANGGQVSTSALAASQQAQNYYNAQLADVIPQLQQNAYSQYLQGQTAQKEALTALLTEREVRRQDWQDGYNLLAAQIKSMEAQKPVGTTYAGNGTVSAEDVFGLQKYLNSLGYGYNLAEDGKYGSLSAAAVKKLTGQDLTAEEAVKRWKAGTLKNNGVGTVDYHNLLSLGTGMSESQIMAAINGDERYATQLSYWLSNMKSMGQIETYEEDGVTKFRWVNKPTKEFAFTAGKPAKEYATSTVKP